MCTKWERDPSDQRQTPACPGFGPGGFRVYVYAVSRAIDKVLPAKFPAWVARLMRTPPSAAARFINKIVIHESIHCFSGVAAPASPPARVSGASAHRSQRRRRHRVPGVA